MKKIHQIYISDNNNPPSEYVSNQMRKLKRMYPDYEYVLYNNEMCREQIRSLSGNKGVKLYDSLNAYAFRADLARYCILYQHGGFYFDSIICPEFKIEFDNFSVLYRDMSGIWDGYSEIYNGVMYFHKIHHPFLKDAIDQSLKNINNQSYGDNPLGITGPIMLGKLKEYDIRFGECKPLTSKQQSIYSTQRASYFENIIHWLVKPDNTHLSTYDCIGTNEYGQMWYDKKIYNKK